MSRWQPEGRLRLQRSALALFAERGYVETTVAAIAEHSGLTERTFFRHFEDKREALFGDDAELRQVLLTAVAEAPSTARPQAAVAAGLDAVACLLEPQRAAWRRRARLTAKNPELRERELTKLAAWEQGLADALRERGTTPVEAELAAALGLAVYRVAFRRWTGTRPGGDLAGLLREALQGSAALTAGGARRSAAARPTTA